MTPYNRVNAPRTGCQVQYEILLGGVFYETRVASVRCETDQLNVGIIPNSPVTEIPACERRTTDEPMSAGIGTFNDGMFGETYADFFCTTS